MLLSFDFASDVPLYQQLRNQIVLGIASGRLRPGERLPTVRALAEESGVNTMTVSKAYQLLKAEGYLTTDRRSGTVIAAPGGGPGPTAAAVPVRAAAGRNEPHGASGALRRILWR